MNKAIFVDRDGVINKSNIVNGKPHAPLYYKDFFVMDKVKEALEEIKAKGYLTLVITNQPNLSPARATLTNFELSKMHDDLKKNYAIDKIYVCPHINEDNCNCRKPKIGNIMKAKEEFNLDLNSCFLIGDRYQDIVCANNANLKGSFFIDYNYNETKFFSINNYKNVTSLYEICKFI